MLIVLWSNDSYKIILTWIHLHADKVENYLMEVLPEWIKTVKVSKGVFIKVDKKADLKLVIQKLERTKSIFIETKLASIKILFIIHLYLYIQVIIGHLCNPYMVIN